MTAIAACATSLSVFAAGPARAQDSEQAIDALIAETSSPEAAMVTARAQIDSGDITGAVATLERALLADANASDVRLLYASTLCRLGDTQAARIEIAKLDRQQFSPNVWTEAEQACGNAIRRPLPAEEAPTGGGGLSGEVYAGIAYDGDAAGAITLQSDFFASAEHDDGLAAIGGVRLMLRSENYGSTGGFYGGVSGVTKHDISGPDQDYDIGELRVGYGRSGGRTGFSVGAVLGHTRLLGDPYVTEYGAEGELDFDRGGGRWILFRAEAVFQDYKKGFPGDAGDGMRFDLSGALQGRIGERAYFTMGVAGELKTADQKSLGYRGGRLFAGANFALPRRHYVELAGTLRYIDFRDDSPFADRKDFRGFGRAAYGIPLNSHGLFVEGAASYTFRSSSLSSTTGGSVPDLEDYHSPGADLRLIWEF